jgi:outer membrane protein TolC
LALLTAAAAHALTEQEALYQALKSNPDIAVTRSRLVADSLSWVLTRAGRLPTLALDASAKYAPVSKSTGGSFSTDNSNTLTNAAAAEATQVLPGGATLTAGVGQSMALDDLNPDSASHTTSLSVGITQPLLKNAWSNATLDYTLKVERLNHDQFSLSQKKQLLSTLSDVRSSYWSWYEKTQLLAIAGKNSEYSRKQLEVARERLRVGQNTELDTLSAALDALRSQQNVMSAAGAEQSARRGLALALGLAPATLEMAGDLTVIVADLPGPEEFLRQAEAYDPQLKVFTIATAKLKLEEKKRRADFWPTLSLSGSYTYSLTGDTLFGDNTASSRNALIALIASYDLPTTPARIAATQNRLSQEQNNLEREKYRRELANRVAELADSWQQEKTRLEIMAAARVVAQRQLEAAQQGYQLGTVDRLALEKAQNDFAQVAVTHVQAQVGLKKLEIIFDEMSGQILTKFGVQAW